MKYAVIVDSSCDLVIENKTENNIYMDRVPLRLRVGEREYVDDFNLDIKSFMEDMKSYHGTSGSAAPSPEEWYNAFRQADEVFAVTISGELSGSYSSASVGKHMALEDEPEKKIHIFDSKSAGAGLTLIVRKIQELIAKEKSFEEIVEAVEEYKTKIKTFFILESIDNLVKNGRVSALSGKLAGMLGIKILGQGSSEGKIELLRKIRGKDAIYKKTVQDMLANGYKGGNLVISQCFNKEKVQFLLDNLREHTEVGKVETMPTSGLCSFYAEMGCIILAYEI